MKVTQIAVLSVTLLAVADAGVSQTEVRTQGVSLELFAAGSLRAPLDQIAAEYEKRTGIRIQPTFGPSGLLRERIENGERPDIFASADMASPGKLADKGLGTIPRPFTANEVCVVAPRTLKVDSSSALDVMLGPEVKQIGAGTPIADPLGDYTEAIFANADRMRPGSKKILDGKAIRLIGGRDAPRVPAGRDGTSYFLLDGKQADLMLTYCSGAESTVGGEPRLSLFRFPANLSVNALFGYTVVTGAKPQAADFGRFLESDIGQAILRQSGFKKI
jgi:molybdate transport system substrate-binding protein